MEPAPADAGFIATEFPASPASAPPPNARRTNCWGGAFCFDVLKTIGQCRDAREPQATAEHRIPAAAPYILDRPSRVRNPLSPRDRDCPGALVVTRTTGRATGTPVRTGKQATAIANRKSGRSNKTSGTSELVTAIPGMSAVTKSRKPRRVKRHQRDERNNVCYDNRDH